MSSNLYDNMVIDNPLKDINSFKYPVKVMIKHYVSEFWYEDDEVKTWKNPMFVKDKDNYQVMDCLFAFQFYDLVNVFVNGEYLEGKKKYNIGPLIYIGEREYINENESVIIDRFGVKHLGNSGITYEEYLTFIDKSNLFDRKIKKINKDLY